MAIRYIFGYTSGAARWVIIKNQKHMKDLAKLCRMVDRRLCDRLDVVVLERAGATVKVITFLEANPASVPRLKRYVGQSDSSHQRPLFRSLFFSAQTNRQANQIPTVYAKLLQVHCCFTLSVPTPTIPLAKSETGSVSTRGPYMQIRLLFRSGRLTFSLLVCLWPTTCDGNWTCYKWHDY